MVKSICVWYSTAGSIYHCEILHFVQNRPSPSRSGGRKFALRLLPKAIFLVFHVILCSVLVFGCLLVQNSFAAELYLEGDWSVGVGAGRVITQFDDTNYIFGMPTQGFTDVTIDGNDGWFFQVMLNKAISEYLVIGIESGYIRYGLDFTINPVGTSGISGDMGEMRIVPFFAQIKAQYAIERYTSYSMRELKFVPHLIFGIGGLFIDFEEDDYATSNGYSVNTDSSSLVLKYGAGLDFFISENIAISIESSYLNAEVKTDMVRAGTTNTEDVENDSWLVGGAFKFFF